jgi:hypothetical protein
MVPPRTPAFRGRHHRFQGRIGQGSCHECGALNQTPGVPIRLQHLVTQWVTSGMKTPDRQDLDIEAIQTKIRARLKLSLS